MKSRQERSAELAGAAVKKKKKKKSRLTVVELSEATISRRVAEERGSGGESKDPRPRLSLFGWRPRSRRCPDTDITPLAAAAPEDRGMRGRRGAWGRERGGRGGKGGRERGGGGKVDRRRLGVFKKKKELNGSATWAWRERRDWSRASRRESILQTFQNSSTKL